MAYINIYKVREELVVFLRNSDIFSVGTRGVTTTTEEFDGDDAETEFVLTNTPVRNVRSVTVEGASQSLGTDYTVDYSTSTITFSTAPTSGTDNVDIQYDYGDNDKIFPDFPRPDISISKFPRIGVDLIGIDSEPGGFGNVNKSNIEFTVVVYGLGSEAISGYINNIRQAFIASYNSFYYLKHVYPIRIGPMLKAPFERGQDKILQQNADFRSYFNYEIN